MNDSAARDAARRARRTRCSHGGRFRYPHEDTPLLDLLDRLHELADGALDPLVGRDLELLGYDPSYSLAPATHTVRKRERRHRACWRDVERDGSTITTDRPVLLDVGAAGEGRLVDIVAQTLIGADVPNFVVDAGGDLCHHGDRPLSVGLEHPLDPERVVGVVELSGNALAASAINRRAWEDGLHHILDARTSEPTQNVLATWVIANNATHADGIATALFLTYPSRLADAYSFEFVRMSANGVEASPGSDGELFA